MFDRGGGMGGGIFSFSPIEGMIQDEGVVFSLATPRPIKKWEERKMTFSFLLQTGAKIGARRRDQDYSVKW